MELIIDGLSAWYGQAKVLHETCLRADDGEVVGLLGRNGGGKTTLLRTVAGLHRKRQGSVKLGGVELGSASSVEIARRGVSLVREGGAMPLSLTVEENLRLGIRLSEIRKRPGRTVEEIWEAMPILGPLRRRKAGVLSGGERQALAAAIGFISSPDLLLIDEPSAGLSPQTANDVFDFIREMCARARVTVVVVEQSPERLDQLASRNYMLELGAITAEGTVREIIDKARTSSNERSVLSDGGDAR